MRIVASLLLSLAPLAAQAKVDFEKQIAPILVSRCIECHGPKEQKGDLRLDAREFVFAEGDEDYWTVIPKDPGDSELVHRLGLPLDDEEIMPAKGEPLSKEQQALIQRWVTEGATWPEAGDEWIAKELAAQVLPKITFDLPVLDEAQKKSMSEAIAKLREKGIVVQQIAADTHAVEANLSLLRDKIGDAEIALLQPLAPALVWLNVSRTNLTDAGARSVAALTQLRRLNVANTKLTDKGFGELFALKGLEHLNAYGTELGDDGLAMMASLPKLRKLYAWQTKVSKAGVAAIQDHLARVQVDLGDYVEERLAAAKAEIARRDQKKAADKKAAAAKAGQKTPINDKCPVSGAAVDPAHAVDHEGRRVAFCCEKCLAKFVKAPAKYVAKLPKQK